MKSVSFSLRLVLAVAMIIFGILFLLDILVLPEVDFVMGLGSAIVGLILLAVPGSTTKRVGLIALLLGTYITMRAADIVEIDVIRLALGCLLVIAGSIGIFTDLKGGESELAQKEPEKE